MQMGRAPGNNPFTGKLPTGARGTRGISHGPRSAHAPRVEGGRVFLFKPPARRIVSTYAEPHDQFNVMLSGSYFATWYHKGRERRIHARAGDVVYWPAGTRRTEHNDPADPMRLLSVFCTWRDPTHELPTITHDRQRLITAMTQVMLGVENSLLPHRGVILSGYAAAVVAEYMRLTEPGGEELVGRLVQHVRHHLREPLRLSDIARSVGLEPNYFGRRYRELTGRTPMDDVRRVRIDHALGLLRAHPDLPLKEVATRVGMGNCQLLARWLKQSLGLTSREIRGGGGRVR